MLVLMKNVDDNFELLDTATCKRNLVTREYLGNLVSSGAEIRGVSFIDNKLVLRTFESKLIKEKMLDNKTILVLDINDNNITAFRKVRNAIKSCDNIKVYNLSRITKMSDFFKGKVCSLDLSEFDTSQVTDMSCMFAGLETSKLDLSSFDTSKVETIMHMFSECNIGYIDMSGFNTSNITNMDGVFRYSVADTIKGLEDFDTRRVVTMTDMFRGTSVDKINLSSFDTSNVEWIDRTFMSSEIPVIDIHSFDLSHRFKNDLFMFKYCETNKIILNSKSYKKYKKKIIKDCGKNVIVDWID